MIKYLKRKLINWLHEDNGAKESAKLVSSSDGMPESGMIRFELFPAIGGRILKVVRYVDSHNTKGHIGNSDRSVDMYIITDSDNVGERVSKIINIQMYK